MIMEELLILLGETMMISTSTFGKIIKLLLLVLYRLDGLNLFVLASFLFTGHFTVLNLVGLGAKIHLFS